MEQNLEQNIENNKKYFEKLLLKYQNKIYAYALKLCKNKIEAEDLIQEVNLKALLNIDKYDHQNKFESWILLLTRNIFINNYRKNKLIYNTIENNIYDSELIQFSNIESDSNIIYQELLEKIKSEPNYLLILGLSNGYKYKELSEIFDISEGTIKSKIFYCREKLKEMLVNFI